MSEKSSGVSSMREAISIVAGPKDWGDTRESWLARVPRKVQKVTYRTVKALWYGEITDPEHRAAREIQRVADAIVASRDRARQIFEYETLAVGLQSRDPEFHREDINSILHAAHLLRTLART
jgi:hypothetical protein